jgi:hypothetical protein
VEQEVLGLGVLNRIEANAEIVGSEVVEIALSRLRKDLREEIQNLTPLSWIALERVEQFQDAIAIEAHRHPEKLHDEAIRRAQELSFKTAYRIVLRMASDRWLVSRTQTMFRRTRRIGQLRSRIHAPGEATLRLSDWPNVCDRYVRQVVLGIETLLELTGRVNVETSYSMRPDGADIEARWEKKSTVSGS